jgi:hypothetical protein
VTLAALVLRNSGGQQQPQLQVVVCCWFHIYARDGVTLTL